MNDKPDIIILYGVPKGQGLYGNVPTQLPKVNFAQPEKKKENSNDNLVNAGLLFAAFCLFLKWVK